MSTIDQHAPHDQSGLDAEQPPRRVLLVDISAFAHAAWHGDYPTMDSKGECCRVIRGVVKRLHELREQFEWDLLVSVMDPEGGSLYRLGLYPDYKANRPESDPDFTRQKRALYGQLKALGLNPILKAGIEADDLLGTIAVKEAAAGSIVGVVSPDKDILQIVSDNISIIRPTRDANKNKIFEHYVPQAVFERLGVWPEQVADWLALQGDTSDNIPGVDKVGPTYATQWLQLHGTLENVMANAHTIKGVRGKNLVEMLPMMPTIRLLTTILLDVEIERHEWSNGKASYAEASRIANHLMLSDIHSDWSSESSEWGVEILSAPTAAPRSRSGWGAKM